MSYNNKKGELYEKRKDKFKIWIPIETIKRR